MVRMREFQGESLFCLYCLNLHNKIHALIKYQYFKDKKNTATCNTENELL